MFEATKPDGVPAFLLGSCAQCGGSAATASMRDFDGRKLCASCFQVVLTAAEATINGMAVQLREPDRLCSNCRAMVDPAVGSVWCSVLELGPQRASLCENFVPLAVQERATKLSEAQDESQDLEQLWESVCAELRTSANSTHSRWLAEASPISLDNYVLRMGVRDDQTRQWLKARFGPAISRSLELNGYPKITVEFEPAEGGSNGSTRGQGAYLQADLFAESEPAPSTAFSANGHSSHDTVTAHRIEEVRGSGLNPACTFDRFVVGTGNRLAHAGSLSVSEGVRAAYNPLFLHGGVGVGKTHLLQAIAAKWLGRGQKAAYISSETFTNELIAAIRGGSTGSFRSRYRHIDILLVDDIHFIAGKDSTQEEFFHTFDALYNSGKQIVLSSDRPPNELRVLEERLKSRFSWGLLADIEPPDLLTRVEILKARVAERGRSVSDDVLACLASQNTRNVRELEGLLNRLLAMADIHGVDPTLAIASGLTLGQGRQGQVTSDAVLQSVAAYYRVTISALSGKQRTRAVTLPRHVAMYLMREDAGMSLPHIGRILGDRDHTTVMYGCSRLAKDLETDERVLHDVEAIRSLMASCGPFRG